MRAHTGTMNTRIFYVSCFGQVRGPVSQAVEMKHLINAKVHGQVLSPTAPGLQKMFASLACASNVRCNVAEVTSTSCLYTRRLTFQVSGVPRDFLSRRRKLHTHTKLRTQHCTESLRNERTFTQALARQCHPHVCRKNRRTS